MMFLFFCGSLVPCDQQGDQQDELLWPARRDSSVKNDPNCCSRVCDCVRDWVCGRSSATITAVSFAGICTLTWLFIILQDNENIVSAFPRLR